MAGVNRRIERIVINLATKKIPERSVRRLTQNLVGGLSEGTAVDTGFASAFHEARAGRPARHSITPGKPTSSEVSNARGRSERGTGKVVNGWKITDGKIFITSVPYFPILDEKHQGPSIPITKGVIRKVLNTEVRKEKARLRFERL